MPFVWRQLFPEDAMAHPCYGLRGWLLGFYAAALGTFLFGVYDAIVLEEDLIDRVAPTHTEIGLATAFKLVRTGLILPFLVMAPLGNRQMPEIAIACLWTSTVLALLSLAVVPFPFIGPCAIAIALLAAALTPYLISSERVNVTYRRRTRDDAAKSHYLHDQEAASTPQGNPPARRKAS